MVYRLVYAHDEDTHQCTLASARVALAAAWGEVARADANRADDHIIDALDARAAELQALCNRLES